MRRFIRWLFRLGDTSAEDRKFEELRRQSDKASQDIKRAANEVIEKLEVTELSAQRK